MCVLVLCMVCTNVAQAVEAASGPTVSGMEWLPVAAMSEPRAEQTATSLPDGDVLVAGGYNGFTPAGGSHVSLSSAELFDPATNEWIAAGRMLVGRSGQVASLLPDGEVLVMGGWEMPKVGEYVRTAETYDPATNTWTTAPVPVELEESLSLTTLPNGKVLLLGVFGTELSDQTAGAAVYDPSSSTWTRVASPKLLRANATATLLPDGDVLVIGGLHSEPAPFPVDKVYTVLASAEEYDPATNTWTEVAAMSHARMDQTATLMPGGEVLVTGGIYESTGVNDYSNSLQSAETYDPATNNWTARASMLLPRAQHTATLMTNGDVLLAGGYDCGAGNCLGYGGSGDCCGASSAEVYDPASNTWEFTGPVLTGSEHTAILLPGGGVLVAGGNVGPVSDYELSNTEIYTVEPPRSSPPAKTTSLPPPSITHLTESHKRWREGTAKAQISNYTDDSAVGHGARNVDSAHPTQHRRTKTPLGTTITFTLNEQATITFTFVERLPGRRSGKKCLAPSQKDHHGRPCKRSVMRGTLTFTGHTGENTVVFQGDIPSSTKLQPGSYTLSATALNTAGQSATVSLQFEIVRNRSPSRTH